MREVQNHIKYLIHTHSPILISGEKGTGKEEIGKIIHQARTGGSSSFVSVNLALLPWPLQESQIFALPPSALHKGAFYQAQGGTLFISSIERLTKEVQGIFIQALEEQKEDIQACPQIISSTTSDIDDLVKKDEFDQKLFKLISTERLLIPPLRTRGEDIKAAAIYFLDEIKNTTHEGPSSLSPDVEHYLLSHEWQNNVKELKRTIMRACAIAKGERITMDDIHPQQTDSLEEFLEKKLNSYMHNIKRIENFNLYETVISEVERALILISLKETQGNQLRASKLLSINRNTLKKKIDQLHIDVNEFKEISDTH
jgi:DNA-binding NtrC family response regulator